MKRIYSGALTVRIKVGKAEAPMHTHILESVEKYKYKMTYLCVEGKPSHTYRPNKIFFVGYLLMKTREGREKNYDEFCVNESISLPSRQMNNESKIKTKRQNILKS